VGGVVGRWRELVGEEIADHCVPETFEAGRCEVARHAGNLLERSGLPEAMRPDDAGVGAARSALAALPLAQRVHERLLRRVPDPEPPQDLPTRLGAASALLFAIALGALLAIKPVERPEIARGPSPWAQMVEGLRYVRHNKLVLGAISLDLFAVLLGGATAMLPVFARDVLHAGPEGLGHLRAAPAIGATRPSQFPR